LAFVRRRRTGTRGARHRPTFAQVAFPATVGDAMSEEPAARAAALVERLFALLHDCRALVPQLEGPGSEPESVSAEAERLLYYALSARSRRGWCARPRTP
jgi:hypothetical protein